MDELRTPSALLSEAIRRSCFCFSGTRHHDYALSEPFASLTLSEFGRLKELQQEAREAAKAADDARCWRLKETINWADNSVEEIYEDKDGNTKHVTVVGPHGDAC